MSVFDKIYAWHQTKTGLLVFGLVELAGAVLFASWAVDSRSLLEWFLANVLFIGAIQNFIKLIVKMGKNGH